MPVKTPDTESRDHHVAEGATPRQESGEGEWAAKVAVISSTPCRVEWPLIPVPTPPTTPSQPPTQPPPFMPGPGTKLKASHYATLDINDFLLVLVDFQQSSPGGLNHITILELDGTQPIACRSLHPDVEDLKLPKLRELVIKGAAMQPQTLERLLCNHKRTLHRLKIESTALTISKDDKDSGYEAWIDVLEGVRQHLQSLESVEIGRLFWRWRGPSPEDPSTSSTKVHSKIVLPQKKFHRRVQRSWNGKRMQWRLEQDGVWAELQVHDALDSFITELKKVRDEPLKTWLTETQTIASV